MIKYKVTKEEFERFYRVRIRVYKEDNKNSKMDFDIFESNMGNHFARYMIDEIELPIFTWEDKDISNMFKYNDAQYEPLGNTNMLCIDCESKFDLLQLEKITKLVIEKLDEIMSDYNQFEEICQSYKKSY
ncbi:hypothetical protein FDC62_12880 [Clostridium botulinum]|uniref:hypothetical protein n=1 Tax=Clostridium botulinum TaxID=1491 RepID=UPI0009925C62|nr:hypothetical protein [Clostridium botulinum]NFO99063.1 hypothetical protein [Clostridium botulinum]OOV52385.1 hypothetical protein B1A66_04210 [Clostridium botulinum D/C]OOV55745.1 hypothetical protein B1A67_07825 [Clostridium botulinum D/C]OOV57192.1 hypothetical protein B0673_04905 [Clostridium botulinum D/C]